MFNRIVRKMTNTDPTGESRSPQWPGVRKAHLEREPACRVCGGTSKLEVHHKKPFHLFPDLELEDSNLITLCEGWKNCNCHLVIGHHGNFKKFNDTVVADAAKLNKGITEDAT